MTFHAEYEDEDIQTQQAEWKLFKARMDDDDDNNNYKDDDDKCRERGRRKPETNSCLG